MMSAGTFAPTRRAANFAGVPTSVARTHTGYRLAALLVGTIVIGVWAASCAEVFIRIGGALHTLLANPCSEQLGCW